MVLIFYFSSSFEYHFPNLLHIFVAEQYGYRRGLSTTNASHGLTEIILSTLNNNRYIARVFCDFDKSI